MNEIKYITDMNPLSLREELLAIGEPPFRAKQIQHWIYQKLAASFDEMSDLPLSLRSVLNDKLRLCTLSPRGDMVSYGDTIKTLFKLADGKTIESTLMHYPAESGKERNTVCVSTQVGCPVGCPFCATGQQGFERNLTAGEIIDQVLYFARHLKGFGEDKITNIVFMGMGEPLANYESLLQAIESLNSADMFGLSARNMTISTAGLVPQINRLSGEKLQVGLAISLHAADDALRNRLVPVNKKYPLKELMVACRNYFDATGRRITFEYALFAGINDSLSHARLLAHLLHGFNCHVNLIPSNNTANSDYRAPATEVVQSFKQELERLGINATIRQSRGQDINAGCGQLRSRFNK
ncbi:MAG: 23S rRNA (adenine(2503)-C(2))-methyltransferase RlmN [Dehalococcoidales bacterium]|jgi:23S rRNA (adenine2503-C2)-methyltransferase|nr:23S rRNA (adenine(2503)-C(2))-methyltransferase RlmN [Dehalococcoidales bacterium]